MKSERTVIERARAAKLWWFIRGQLIPEGLVGFTVPGLLCPLLNDFAKIDAVGSGDHAAWHGISLVADIGTVPGPATALPARGARRMLSRLKIGRASCRERV